MADVLYGGDDRPVRLDPFRTLTGVHWPPPWLLYSFGLGYTATSGQDLSCALDGSYPALADSWPTYLASFALVFSGTPAAHLYRDGAWEDPGTHAVEITPPPLPGANFDPFKYASGFGSNAGWIVSEGQPRFTAPTGNALPVLLPGGVSAVDAASFDGDLFGDIFTGEPQCTTDSVGHFANGAKYATVTGTTTPGDTSSFSGFADFTIPRSGFAATVDGKTYDPVGIAAAGGTPFGGGLSDPNFYVLFKKRPASTS